MRALVLFLVAFAMAACAHQPMSRVERQPSAFQKRCLFIVADRDAYLIDENGNHVNSYSGFGPALFNADQRARIEVETGCRDAIDTNLKEALNFIFSRHEEKDICLAVPRDGFAGVLVSRSKELESSLPAHSYGAIIDQHARECGRVVTYSLSEVGKTLLRDEHYWPRREYRPREESPNWPKPK